MVLLVAFVYAAAHLIWYLGTPLGQVPVLDERENLQLAFAIAQNAIPVEPFYRAMGYPLGLSIVPLLGGTESAAFAAGLWFGVLLHAVGAVLAARLAANWFDDLRAAAVCGLLFALNPVFVHHATQLVDSTFGMVLMLAALVAQPLSGRSVNGRTMLIAGLCTGASVIVRPNYLLFAGAFVLLTFWTLRGNTTRWTPQPLFLWLLAGVAAPLLVYSSWQWQSCGQFGFLPTQGTYNLWAANRPGTHGRYFSQTIALPPGQAHQNPTRIESVALYCAETGLSMPADLGTVNTYWSHRLYAAVSAHPLSWLHVLTRKFYALCNDWEQYNNKTYAFHKADSPWLRYNPIGWGLLLLLAIPGSRSLYARDRTLALGGGIIFAALSVSVLLVYVSSRFRLPLEALLCVIAGGIVRFGADWRALPRLQQGALVGLVTCAGFITFSSFDAVRDRHTFIQDHLLLASAAEQLGEDASAWDHARNAHQLAPDNADAVRTMVAAYFNLLLSHAAVPAEEPDWLQASQQLLSRPGAIDDPLAPIAGLALWRANLDTGAEMWESILAHSANATARANAAAALVLTHHRAIGTLPRLPQPHPFLLRNALGETTDLAADQVVTVRALFSQRAAPLR